MATLGDLKTRIADELLKRNLNNQIALHIARAIEFYAGRRFWFNTGRIAGSVTPNEAGRASLAGAYSPRLIDEVRVGPTTLRRRDISEIYDGQASVPVTGEPYEYAIDGSEIVLNPVPLGAVSLVVFGTFDLPALDSDAASNAWTNEGADLIAARARMTLYRDVLRDPEGMALAKDAIRDAESDLDMKTIRRVGTGQVRLYA